MNYFTAKLYVYEKDFEIIAIVDIENRLGEKHSVVKEFDKKFGIENVKKMMDLEIKGDKKLNLRSSLNSWWCLAKQNKENQHLIFEPQLFSK
jgi:hypothetical protein